MRYLLLLFMIGCFYVEKNCEVKAIALLAPFTLYLDGPISLEEERSEAEETTGRVKRKTHVIRGLKCGMWCKVFASHGNYYFDPRSCHEIRYWYSNWQCNKCRVYYQCRQPMDRY